MAKAIKVQVVGDYDDRDIRRAMKDLEKLQMASLSMGGKFKSVGEEMKSMGDNIGKVGKSMTLGLTLPLVGVGVAAIAVQKDFDVAMKSLQVNANASAADLERLSELAKKMGADTVFSAGEAADAMLELSKGGLGIAAIEGGALAATMNLAATESIGLAEAGGIVVNSMNQFGIAAADSAKVADILAAGAVASTAGVTDLASGLKFVGTTAKQFGFSIGESVTALAALNNAGIDSTTAGTSLNRFMLGLIGTTPKASKQIAQLGLNFKDATGELLPMDKILKVLQDNLSNLSAPARAQALKNIFGIEGMRAANVLLELGSKGFSNLGDQVNKSGVAAELANARMSGVAGALEQLKGSAETAALEIGEVLAPFITQLSNGIKTLVDRFTALPASMQSVIVGIGVIAAAIGPLLLVFGKVVSLAGVLTTALGGITIAGSILAIKVIAVVAVLAAIALAFKYAYDNSEPLRKAVANLSTTLQQVFNVIKNSVLGAFDSLNSSVGKSTTAFTLVGNYIKAFFTVYVTYLTGIIKALGMAFEVAMKVFEVGFTILQMGAAIIRGVLVASFDILMNKLGPISGRFRAVAEGVKAAFGAIAGFVSSAFNNVGSIVEGFINKAIDAVNVLIRAFNFLAKFLPGVSEATEIAEFRFANLSGAVTDVANGASLAATAVDGWSSAAGRANLATKNTAVVNKVAATSFDGVGTAATSTGAATDKASEKTKKLQDETKRLTDVLKDSIQKAKDYAKGISDSFVGMLSLSDAFDAFTDRQTKVTETLAALTKFQAEIQGEATDDQKANLLSLQKAYQDASADAAKGAQSIVEEFVNQGKKLAEFTTNMNLLLSRGLSRQAFETIIAAGADRGANIADALAKGNIDANIANVNAVYTSVAAMGQQVGNQASGNFMMQGVVLAQSMLVGLIKEFMPAGKKRRELLAAINGMVSEAVGSMAAIANVPVPSFTGAAAAPFTAPSGANQSYSLSDAEAALVLSNLQAIVPGNFDPFAGIPFFAKGGIVTGPMLGMVGEAGPEAIIPLNRAGGIGSTTINLTVHAGMGADGTQVGEQIVSALRQYQRRNGALPLTVA
jgi:TP901 family phage tail tape measure protein